MKTPRTLSPYMLIQEFLRDDPWRLLVACILLNQTSAKQVHRVINEFFDRWPTPEKFFYAQCERVKYLIRPLGFKNVRYDRLLGMTMNFMDGKRPPEKMFGVGKYASDSHKIFCEGYLVLDVLDKELKNYVRWAQEAGGAEACDAGSGGV